METIKQDRLGPSVILLVALLAAVGLLLPDEPSPQVKEIASSEAAQTDGTEGKDPQAQIEVLEKTIGQGEATVETWKRYAEAQHTLKQYDYAAQAYQMALALEPVNRKLLFQRGLMLALDGDADTFHAFMRGLAHQDPRLTYDLLERKECKPYLVKPRFQRIHREAYNQYLD